MPLKEIQNILKPSKNAGNTMNIEASALPLLQDMFPPVLGRSRPWSRLEGGSLHIKSSVPLKLSKCQDHVLYQSVSKNDDDFTHNMHV